MNNVSENFEKYNGYINNVAAIDCSLDQLHLRLAYLQGAEMTPRPDDSANTNESVDKNSNLNTNDIKISKFTGTYFFDKGSHPKFFIQELESAIEINEVNEKQELELPKRNLEVPATH